MPIILDSYIKKKLLRIVCQEYENHHDSTVENMNRKGLFPG